MNLQTSSYHDEVDLNNNKKLEALLKDLPPYCSDFFRGIGTNTSSKTRVAYAYDLRRFFKFLLSENPGFKKDVNGISLEYLERVPIKTFEKYINHLKYRIKDGNKLINKNSGISRKISTLKSFYNYMTRTQRIKYNPTTNIILPKHYMKEIIRLEPEETCMLLDIVETGTSLTSSQQKYHNKVKLRDLAIMTLLLGTGIRISECIGLNIDDINFKSCGMSIRRKGGNQVIIYFSDEVKTALLNYLSERTTLTTLPGHEKAFFLSMQRSRISISAVENLVKKYSLFVAPSKNITPHKLRSTYGTNLYRVTHDIYLVADILGHSDVNTTKKHYAAIEEDHRRSARNAVTLRENA